MARTMRWRTVLGMVGCVPFGRSLQEPAKGAAGFHVPSVDRDIDLSFGDLSGSASLSRQEEGPPIGGSTDLQHGHDISVFVI